MTPRLTPIRVAERELSRLTQREERLIRQLQTVRAEKANWASVLDALNGNDPALTEDEEDEA